MKRVFLYAALMILTGAMGTRSEDKSGTEHNPYQLPDSITVTANRTPVPLRETASSITVITQKEITQSQAHSVADLLRTVGSVDVVQSGAEGGVISVFLRGANSQHTLVFVDGVKMNDPSSPSSGFDFSSLQLNNVERIEILRGPQSVLYGSDAIGGVIQVFTRNGFGKPKVNLTSETSRYDSYRQGLNISGGANKLSYTGSVSYFSTNGYSTTEYDKGTLEPDGCTNTSASANVSYQLNQTSRLSLTGKYTDASADLDAAYGIWEDPNYSSHSKTGNVTARWLYEPSDSKWKHQAGVYFLSNRITQLDNPDDNHPSDLINSLANGDRLKFNWQTSYAFQKMQELTVGVETENEAYSSSYYSEGMFGPYTDTVKRVDARTTGVYALTNLAVADSWFSSVGVRMDHHERSGDIVTYRITSAYLFDKIGTKAKATIGTGFKEPSLYQLLHPIGGNPNLKPEKSTGWEIGVEQELAHDALSISVSHFWNKFSELIEYVDFVVGLQNISKATTRGVESSINFHMKKFSAQIEYTYTDAFNSLNGSRLIRRPLHKAGLKTSFKPFDKANLRLQVEYTGERMDKDFSGYPVVMVKMPSYTVVTVGSSFDISSHVQLNGRIENLLDEKYQEVLWYASAGRSLHAGISITL